MYLFVTLWRETDISKKMFTLKGEYFQTFEQAFPDFKKRLKAGIQGCVVYFNKEKENNCYWADVKAVQVYRDSIVIYFNNCRKLDMLSGDIYVSLIRFGYRNGWINKKQGFLPLLCIVDNKEDFDEIRKNTFRVVKDKNILAHLRELSSRNDWKSICDLFEPLEKIHERDEWDNHEVLYEIGYACNKLAEPQRERAVDIITGLSHNLKQDGSIIIIENGSKQNCESFKRIRNALVNRGIYNIYSPCVSIWEPKTQYHCACFNMVRCFWDIPKIYEYLRMHGLRKAARYDVPFTRILQKASSL